MRILVPSTAVLSGIALGAAVFLAAPATLAQSTITVQTSISTACAFSAGSTTATLTPTYFPLSDSGVGSATTLSYSCVSGTGNTATIAFTDPTHLGTTEFDMKSGADVLKYYLYNAASCSTATGATDALTEAATNSLPYTTSGTYNVCAAVQAGQTTAKAKGYTDTVTATIAVTGS